ncbi:MAG TPA: AlkA N-terminal domain-containing protein [Longimicrobiales bacterium]
MELSLPPHFDGRNLLAFLRARQVEPLEAVGPRSFARPLEWGGRCAVVRLGFSGRRLARVGAALPAGDRADGAAAAVRRLLGADWDYPAFAAASARDPLLGPLVARFCWLARPQLPDPYEALIRAILEQQVSIKAAATLTRRLIERFGRRLPPPDDGFVAFPRPEDILAAGPGAVRGIGLTGAKVRAVIAASEAAAAGTLDAGTLTDLPGVGPWSAGYVRMRALSDDDVFLEGDLGIRVALGRLLGRDGPVPAREARDLAERWAPWRTHAMIYLWHSLTAPGERA